MEDNKGPSHPQYPHPPMGRPPLARPMIRSRSMERTPKEDSAEETINLLKAEFSEVLRDGIRMHERMLDLVLEFKDALEKSMTLNMQRQHRISGLFDQLAKQYRGLDAERPDDEDDEDSGFEENA